MSEPLDPNALPVRGGADESGYRPPPAFAPRYGVAAQPLPVPYFPAPYGQPPGYPGAPAMTATWPPDAVWPPGEAKRSDQASDWEHRRKMGIWLYTGIAVMAAAAVIAAIVVATSTDSSTAHRIGLPNAFDNYTKINSQASQQVVTSMRSLGAGDPDTAAIFNAASIGVYSRNTGDLPGLIALTLPSSKVPGSAAQSPDQLATELVRGALTADRTIDMPPGPHG
ncbi:MAG TPA: hypothetical protein VGF84_07690, partial [Micromonosporaceae bacterium]